MNHEESCVWTTVVPLSLFLTASIRPYLSNPMLKVFMAVYSILLKFLCPQTGDENDNIYIFRVL